MFGRLAVSAAALLALSACANVEYAGRNARSDGGASVAPAPVTRSAPEPVATPAPALPPPQRVASAPSQPPQPQRMASATPTPSPAPVTPPPSRLPPVAAPSVAAPVSAPPVTPNPDDDTVVVPGQVERQVRAPADPRSASERMQDINAWDRCVTHVQAAFESDPMRPQLDSPEDYCSQSLGMANRTAVPESRRSTRRQR
jgi:hypothetical protein